MLCVISATIRLATLLFKVMVNSTGRLLLEVESFWLNVDRQRITSAMEIVLESGRLKE